MDSEEYALYQERMKNAVFEWVKGLPPGSTVRWANKWGGEWRREVSWIDIQLVDLQSEFPHNWIFELNDPDQLADALREEGLTMGDDIFVLLEPYDLAPESAYEPASESKWEWGRPAETKPAWSAEAVNRALSRWIVEHTGRTDLEVHWAFLATATEDAQLALEAAKSIHEEEDDSEE